MGIVGCSGFFKVGLMKASNCNCCGLWSTDACRQDSSVVETSLLFRFKET